MHIGWPEGILLALGALNLVMVACLDGSPRTGTYKFSVSLVGAAAEFGLLWWGGFFA